MLKQINVDHFKTIKKNKKKQGITSTISNVETRKRKYK